jgi:hypothetical protein
MLCVYVYPCLCSFWLRCCSDLSPSHHKRYCSYNVPFSLPCLCSQHTQNLPAPFFSPSRRLHSSTPPPLLSGTVCNKQTLTNEKLLSPPLESGKNSGRWNKCLFSMYPQTEFILHNFSLVLLCPGYPILSFVLHFARGIFYVHFR